MNISANLPSPEELEKVFDDDHIRVEFRRKNSKCGTCIFKRGYWTVIAKKGMTLRKFLVLKRQTENKRLRATMGRRMKFGRLMLHPLELRILTPPPTSLYDFLLDHGKLQRGMDLGKDDGSVVMIKEAP